MAVTESLHQPVSLIQELIDEILASIDNIVLDRRWERSNYSFDIWYLGFWVCGKRGWIYVNPETPIIRVCVIHREPERLDISDPEFQNKLLLELLGE